jgi:hypothetical protein
VKKKRGQTLCGVLKHPLRVRILEVLNEGPKSPSQFVEEGLVPEAHYDHYQQALSLAAYHFRELEKQGCLRIVDTIPRRGATEHVYEGTARVYFTDEEFEQLSLDERSQFSRISFQGWIARADNERGWSDLTKAMAHCYATVEQIRHDSADRLAASGEEAVPVTFGMSGFQSPPAPPLPPAEPIKR